MQQQASTHLTLNDKDGFLKELRTVTAPAHRRLEEVPLSKAIVSPQITREQYALYLAKMQAFTAPFEQQLFEPLNSIFGDIHTRRKASLLQHDLSFLAANGVYVPQVAPFQFRSGLALPFLAGAMYVLEGSTLGGKFIYKNIHAALQFDAQHGASYFNGYGADTGPKWKSFLGCFCSYATPQNSSEIFKGAAETFELMYDLLSSDK